MRIDILTLFPNQFSSVFSESIIKIGQAKKLVEIGVVNWREFATDPHHTVDDRPYGGGQGMVLKVDVIAKALNSLKKKQTTATPYVVLLTPQGERFDQKKARVLAKKEWLILICGHYEGVDARVSEILVDEEISIGDYVLSGGEIPSMVVVDTLVRLLPQVLGNDQSNQEESFSESSLEHPHYTRPENFEGHKVPEILLSGHHEEIKKWRQEKAQEKTKRLRPDLLTK